MTWHLKKNYETIERVLTLVELSELYCKNIHIHIGKTYEKIDF